jgi:hypothetical protein
MKSIRLVWLLLFLLLASPMTLAQTNPVPLINQPLVPTAIAPGGSSFALTLNGYRICLRVGRQLEWNGPEHHLRQQFATYRDDSSL